jgi:LPXTG-site transpeptidase (sortase) family protein
MSDRTHIGLDDAALRGRLRQPRSSAQSLRISDQVAQHSRTRQVVQSDGLFVGTSRSVRWTTPPRFSTEPSKAVAPTRPHLAQPIADIPVRTQSVPVQASAPIQPLVSVRPKVSAPTLTPVAVVAPQPYAHPAIAKQQNSRVLNRQMLQGVRFKEQFTGEDTSKAKHSKGQLGIVAMACLIFLIGVTVSLQTLFVNNATTAKVAAISKKTDAVTPATNDAASSRAVAAPSTVKPSAATVANYAVAPNLPRYLDIPELGVHARVLSLGILASGALATPNNVHDVGWYNSSSQPGQPGAMLLDGHVSSWTTNGVFYGIKKLKAGDLMKVTRGDGVAFTYRVVKTQLYDADTVDMNAAVRPITPGKPGLNLITCTGQVKPGTSEFKQRVMVFTEQI